MILRADTAVRPVGITDRSKIASLLHFEFRVHRNLDWRAPLDWLGYQPYLALEKNNRILASLACPVDPPGVAWIRMFAVDLALDEREAWDVLWPAAVEMLREQKLANVAAVIPMQAWFMDLMEEIGLDHTHDVVILSRNTENLPEIRRQEAAIIRPMNFDDLMVVEQVDRAAFNAIWRNSIESLTIAFHQAQVATVAEIEGKMVGYQISTGVQMGGHLARLAVLPEYQGQHIGYNLVWDMLKQFRERGITQITVNTQGNNDPSLNLYYKTGFSLTGEYYPVYEYKIRETY